MVIGDKTKLSGANNTAEVTRSSTPRLEGKVPCAAAHPGRLEAATDLAGFHGSLPFPICPSFGAPAQPTKCSGHSFTSVGHAV